MNGDFAAALAGVGPGLQKREILYLLAVGQFRAGEYARSRRLVDQALTVHSFLVSCNVRMFKCRYYAYLRKLSIRLSLDVFSFLSIDSMCRFRLISDRHQL